MVFSLGCFQLLPQILFSRSNRLAILKSAEGNAESVWQPQDTFCRRKSRISCRDFRLSFCIGTTGSKEEIFSEEPG